MRIIIIPAQYGGNNGAVGMRRRRRRARFANKPQQTAGGDFDARCATRGSRAEVADAPNGLF